MYKSFFFFWQIKNSFVSHSNFVPWYWNKHKHIDQRNRIETPQKNPHTYCRLIHDKRGKTIHWIRQSLQQAVLGRLDATHERVKLAHFFTPYTKTNSKWLKKLKCKTRHCSTPRKSIGETFCDINQLHFLRSITQGKRNINQSRRKQMGPNQTEKLIMHSKGNHQQN